MKIKLTALFLLFATLSYAQVDLNYYLPQNVSYDNNIPTPESVIGHQVGEWHISHDRLVNYMYALAEASDRVTIKEYAQTYEHRPLLTLTITSPTNHQNLETIKTQHVQLTDPSSSGSLDISNMPAVAYLGYSVHGNEPSGSNASLLVAYYLAAAQGDAINELLNNTVILLDPSFNPDGLNRFASWVNSRKSHVETSDSYNMEQNEPWPRGRTNHYWFDLNRDWLPVQLPESQGRIAVFHEWKPNVLTDHHEMGTNSTFFFQPGIPSRNNPLTPANTYRLTDKMGEYHAKALDEIGSLYYTRESFDDYYYGKGSTYPDVNGAVGILFEQASSRGHAQESVNGVLRFPFTIKNHFTTSLSTLKAVKEMRVDFLEHQRTFYKDAMAEAKKDAEKAYLFSSKDGNRALALAKLMSRHQINVYKTAKKTAIDGQNYNVEEAFIVPLEQTQYKLIKAMFEKRTTFQDSLFYDVSTWTLPLAFGLDYKSLDSRSYSADMQADLITKDTDQEGSIIGNKSDYAYVFEWYDYHAPTILYALLKKGYRAKVASEPFYNEEGRMFPRGSILIPVANQNKSSDAIKSDLQGLVDEYGIDIWAFQTGLDYKGVSLGSPSFDNVKQPKVMMLVDGGTRSYDAGEVWHLFDQRYKMDLSLLPVDVFNRANIDKYTTLIMVSGNYNDIKESAKEKLKSWVRQGGTIVASRDALSYLTNHGFGKFDLKKDSKDDSSASKTYASMGKFKGAQAIGGSIFELNIDNTNPLFYGYYKNTMPVFRNSEIFMEKSKNPFANPATYGSAPLLSGYISEENLEKLKNTSAVGISTLGKGRVIGFTDNLNFRAFWYGTNKAFINAVFFGPEISSGAAR
ncbi:zinc carboxypeptidase [Fulvivirga sp. RKSG066]|nr:M14 metallopeptidase family protein [Fulvivirga aurantia]MTI20615.1 zinc carboxypeptidase [Fulvivirga aurantia]